MQRQLHCGYWKRFIESFAMIGILGLAITGAALGQESGQPQQQAARGGGSPSGNNYVIGNPDLLGISVWKEPELSQSVPVRSDGKISLPLIGEIQASGLTPLQLKEEIASKLRAFISAPDVNVIVLQMNSQKFNVLGRVARPGSYSLTATTTVLDAIAGAGGFLDFARQKNIYILRKDSQGKEARISFNYKDVIRGKRPEENIALQPNDTIVVP